MAGSRRERRQGFTLFEVLAAAGILALFYTMLAGSAIEGINSEGVSRRRMEASLLADQRLADIETALGAGTAPEIGQSEEEVDLFTVRVDVTPFDATALLGDEIEIAEGAKGLLDASGRSPLRLIDLRVSWLELDREVEVRRTTFAYAPAAVAQLASQAETSGGDGAAAGDEDTAGDVVDPQNLENPTVDDILRLLGESAQ